MSGVITRGRVTRADLAMWDGATATYSRPDASSGTVTGLAVGNEVDVLQVYGAGSVRTGASIASAVASIGTGRNVTLAFAPGEWVVDSNITIPSNFTCRIPAGCVFAVSSGVTLTFSGLVMVEYMANWKSGSGTVVALNPILLPYDVRLAGIVPNSTAARTANTTKLIALLDPTVTGIKGRLLFPNSTGADTYYFNNMVEVRDGIQMDLCGSTLDFAKTYESADDLTGFLNFIRDVTIENGKINVAYDGSAGTNAGSALRIGSRNGYAFGSFTSGIEDEDLTTPQGNITIRNLRIVTNNPSHIILMLGGLDGVHFENVYLNGTELATRGIYYEFGHYHFSATAADIRSSHALNLSFKNIHIDDIEDSAGIAFTLAGAMSATIDGLHMDETFNGLVVRPGEALYYAMGTPYVDMKPHVVMRNITGKNIAGTGIILEGATSAVGGYLASVIAALAAGPEADAQTDLISFSLDGLSIDADARGILVSGKIAARNGSLHGSASSGQLCISSECVDFYFENVDVINSTGNGIRGDQQSPIWGTKRNRLGIINSCLIAGNTGAGVLFDDTEAVLLHNCRIGYNTLYDPAAESTQTIGVHVLAGGKGVVADGCFVTTSGGAVAYDNDNTGIAGCGVRNPRGTITFAGSWNRGEMSLATATQIADITAFPNTADKYLGKQCYDTSNTRLMIAQGANTNSTWISADGATTVTPV